MRLKSEKSNPEFGRLAGSSRFSARGAIFAVNEMRDKKSVDVGSVWWFWFGTSAFMIDKRLRRIQRLLPSDPRCVFCNAPFEGVGGVLMRVLFGKERSAITRQSRRR